MNLPNKLTVLRCIMTPLMLAALLVEFPYHFGVALLLFIAASLTDMLDGKIARKHNLITNLGKFLDPLADKMLTTAAFLGIMCRIGNMDIMCWALMLILTREFMVTSVRLLAAKDGVVVAASFAGKLKTVMQMVSIIFTLTAFQVMDLGVTSRGLNFGLVLASLALIWISVIATVVSGIQYVWALRHYFKEN
ncbi:MAG: CDP-diacylglycerol--glycerol-3-phosphate 3-phosphatidyltransferase [Clostridia bacterium]|nr:CDP-diacylglycerol--glycerol-3-phosphate 3-phosphatidyltransferase [Clostridia bacterium]